MGYVPRQTAPLGLWDFGTVRLKPYVLSADGRTAGQARVDQARATAARACADEDAEGLGFAILHLGEDADWLLVDWWVNGDSLAQRLFAAGTEGGPFLPLAPRPLVACLWELGVIAHERAAFIAAMMDGAGGAGAADAYLADVMKGAC